MNLIETVLGINRLANEALESAGMEDPRVNDIRAYKKDGVIYVPVKFEHSEYELVNGAWREAPVF